MFVGRQRFEDLPFGGDGCISKRLDSDIFPQPIINGPQAPEFK